MTQADSVHSTPRTAAPKPSPDDLTGMAWWNALTEKERRYRMRLAGDTGRAVDAWLAFKAALADAGYFVAEAPKQPGERDLTPRSVLIELLTEEVLRHADLMADLIIARLGSRGFVIVPTEPGR